MVVVGTEVLCKLGVDANATVGETLGILYLKIERAYVIERLMKCTNTRSIRIPT